MAAVPEAVFDVLLRAGVSPSDSFGVVQLAAKHHIPVVVFATMHLDTIPYHEKQPYLAEIGWRHPKRGVLRTSFRAATPDGAALGLLTRVLREDWTSLSEDPGVV